MNSVNKTLYIPLYGKALVSKRGIILNDPKAEEIWSREGFPLKGKARSKWLAFFMGMRAAVIDSTVRTLISDTSDTAVLHTGCGMDSRVLRTGCHDAPNIMWYDLDMPQVITARKKYYSESKSYKMISCDLADISWTDKIKSAHRAVVVMEGISMYLPLDRIRDIFSALENKFDCIDIIMDVYTGLGVKASAWKNPVRSVGAGVITGIDDPKILETQRLRYCRQLSMTPPGLVNELRGFERLFFGTVLAGKAADKIYRLYTYNTANGDE